jgi:hypothetical protein
VGWCDPLRLADVVAPLRLRRAVHPREYSTSPPSFQGQVGDGDRAGEGLGTAPIAINTEARGVPTENVDHHVSGADNCEPVQCRAASCPVTSRLRRDASHARANCASRAQQAPFALAQFAPSVRPGSRYEGAPVRVQYVGSPPNSAALEPRVGILGTEGIVILSSGVAAVFTLAAHSAHVWWWVFGIAWIADLIAVQGWIAVRWRSMDNSARNGAKALVAGPLVLLLIFGLLLATDGDLPDGSGKKNQKGTSPGS